MEKRLRGQWPDPKKDILRPRFRKAYQISLDVVRHDMISSGWQDTSAWLRRDDLQYM